MKRKINKRIVDMANDMTMEAAEAVVELGFDNVFFPDRDRIDVALGLAEYY